MHQTVRNGRNRSSGVPNSVPCDKKMPIFKKIKLSSWISQRKRRTNRAVMTRTLNIKPFATSKKDRPAAPY
ncbi:hypothetical protein VTN49DRAFT_6675 [Thermomyces lanuginosus]|uniref:uncharacterized protein n=1 Tax=Thermomyces lanuginosus TaxID=5541 RepID=UPI003743D383